MRFITAALSAFLLITLQVLAATSADFSGSWSTTYGPLTLKQTGAEVVGQYDMNGSRCLVEGTVQGRRLTFTYREPQAAGAGWFELAADSAAFDGRWRENGDTGWSRWTGRRTGSQPGETAWFDGIWNSTYGPLRLSQNGKTVRGYYRMSDGRFADVTGTASGKELDFSYNECGVKGTGHFTVDSSGSSFNGTWKAEDGKGGNWTGAKVEPKPGRIWLVVLEARWETSLNEREFAYGNMLGAYFARLQNIECRHRFFDDADSLKRACSEIAFLPESAVVVMASHGSKEGLAVGNRTIDAATVADCLSRAANVSLLHFSSCLVMAGSYASDIQKRLPPGISFPISGYATSVDWGGSAAAEFIYFDLILARDIEPAEAAGKLLELMPIAGRKPLPGSPFAPLDLRFQPAR